jgi:RNA polymerase sigma-70 factor (ECF subfamily)
VLRSTPELFCLTRAFLKHEREAAAAVAEAFRAVFERVDAASDDRELRSALHRLTIDACLSRLSLMVSESESSIEALLPRFLEAGAHAQSVARWSADLDSPELRAAARAAIDRLPTAHRVAVLLCDVEGRTSAEAARLLGLPRTTVAKRLHQARRALCTLLEPCFAPLARPAASADVLGA